MAVSCKAVPMLPLAQQLICSTQLSPAASVLHAAASRCHMILCTAATHREHGSIEAATDTSTAFMLLQLPLLVLQLTEAARGCSLCLLSLLLLLLPETSGPPAPPPAAVSTPAGTSMWRQL